MEGLLHGFSIQWQHVAADVHLQPQRQLLPAARRGRWQGVQRHHLAVDRCAGDHRQHSGGGGGLCLCLLTLHCQILKCVLPRGLFGSRMDRTLFGYN